ncbi:MAG: tetratricopeptide repeat protein, partial [Anaerolineae bacterium]|nr:tetratricopeptide repeat protein [Anaerolineae bacterium]
ITLISAPPGYGKTTLIKQFVEQSSYPVAWHTVESRERDLPNLHTHSIQALSEIIPEIGALWSAPRMSARELAADLTACLHKYETQDYFYVLDDIDELIDSASGESWLRTLTETLPTNCHLMLIGRTLPMIPFGKLVSRREILAIGQEQLRFSPDEIEVLAQQTGITLSSQQHDWIETHLGGWPAGLILALQPNSDVPEAFLAESETGAEALFAILAEHMLAHLPPNLYSFLLISSLVSPFTPEICQQVLGLPNADAQIRELLNHNLFVSRVKGGLVYHPLFRNVLQQRLLQKYPDHTHKLRVKLALWFKDHQQYDAAFDYFLAAESVQDAASIADLLTQTHFSEGKFETVLYWRDQLALYQAVPPRLNFTCAMIYSERYEYERAQQELASAEQGFLARRDRTRLWQVKLQQAFILNRQGHPKDAILLAEQVHQADGVPTNLHSYAKVLIGAGHLNSGHASKALNYFEAALPTHREINDTYGTSQLLQYMEMAYLRCSRFAEAFACLQEIVAIRRSLGNATGLATALNDLGYHYHQLGDYSQSRNTFEEGLQWANRATERRSESYLLWSLGDLDRDCGAFQTALRTYNQALNIVGQDEPSLRCSLLISLSTLQRWQKHFDESEALASEAYQLARQHHLILEKYKAALSLCAARIANGNLKRSQSTLRMIADLFTRQRADADAAQAYGLMAIVALREQDNAAAEMTMKQAVSLVQHPFSQHQLITEIVHHPKLRKWIGEYARLVQPLQQAVDELVLAQVDNDFVQEPLSGPIYQLRVYTFGREHVERDGVTIETSAWSAARARELFFYLLLNGPSTRLQISLDFWPELSTEAVKSNFHTTLFRVRQALGEQSITFDDAEERYSLHPSINVWSDATEFESFIARASNLPVRAAHTEDLLSHAVDLYQGEFLPDFDAKWLNVRRETLSNRYLEALTRLGQCAEARLDWNIAIQQFEKVLEIDPYREPVYRYLMNCYAQQGNRKKVLQTYQSLEALFLKELAAEPSLETRKLLRSLIR